MIIKLYFLIFFIVPKLKKKGIECGYMYKYDDSIVVFNLEMLRMQIQI